MKKLIWLVVSCLMVLSLVMASCGTAEEEEIDVTTETRIEKKTETKEEGAKVEEEAGPTGPQYGGTLNIVSAEPTSFDPWTTAAIRPLNVQHDHLFIGDWNATEDEWASDTLWIPDNQRVPALAESWEQIDDTTIVVKLKKGIRFNSGTDEARKLVGDRELKADDIVYTFSRICGFNEGWHGLTGEVSNVEMSVLRYMESVTALDDYTVEFKFKELHALMFWSLATYHATMIIPYEVVEKYGDYNDPMYYVGTGAFYISDYVPSSSFTCLRNPAHWDTSAHYGEDYQLPFIDQVDWMIITDQSTQIAALRTGKVDYLSGVPWQQVDSLKKSNPELKMRYTRGSGLPLWMKQDSEPFSDIRVRQAASLAIDHVSIRDDYFRGYASIGTVPFAASWEANGYFTPYEDMPTEISPLVEGSQCSVKELFSYDPDKAKQLLTEAGYPNGFNCSVACQASATNHVELLLVVAEYLKAVNINMELDTMEDGAYWATLVMHTFPTLCSHQIGLAGPEYVLSQCFRGAPGQFSVYNHGEISDWTYDDMFREVIATMDVNERIKKGKALGLYHKEAVLILTPPCPWSFKFWQPWIAHGGYWGQDNMVYAGTGDIWRQMWIDSDMKYSLTGQR
jgi:peptide/nickel transport system substrate-binding protein